MNTKNMWIAITIVLLLVLGMILFGIFYRRENLALTSQYSDFVEKLKRVTWKGKVYVNFDTKNDKLYLTAWWDSKVFEVSHVAITFKGNSAFLHLVDKLGSPIPMYLKNGVLNILKRYTDLTAIPKRSPP